MPANFLINSSALIDSAIEQSGNDEISISATPSLPDEGEHRETSSNVIMPTVIEVDFYLE